MKRRQFLRIGLGALLPPAVFSAHARETPGPPPLLDPRSQRQFVNPLPIPAVAAPISPGGNHYEIAISQFRQQLGIRDPKTGAPLLTTVWGYAGTYPGPTLEVRRGTPITVRWVNALTGAQGPVPHLMPVDTSLHMARLKDWPGSGVPVVTHLHGGRTEAESDGDPDAWYTAGFRERGPLFRKEVYRYDNDQEPAALWYHDHALGLTRLNVYAGLAGLYLIRDPWEEALGLPSGKYELPLVIQDRSFYASGELYYHALAKEPHHPSPSALPEQFGEVILVNGAAWPVADVEPRRYRLRLVNGSDSRFYRLALSSGQSFLVIGSDGGLLDAPVEIKDLLLAPAERADVIVDFSSPRLRGKTVLLENDAKAPFPDGDLPNPRTNGRIMAFRVTGAGGKDQSRIPGRLRCEPIPHLVPTASIRELLLFEAKDEHGRLKAMLGTAQDGALHWDHPVTENPALGAVEAWDFYNTTPDTHPVHVHLVQFRVVSRRRFKADVEEKSGRLSNIRYSGTPLPPPPEEAGWKDTVRANPGEVTRVVAKFDRPGRYVWHCHILSHEDHEMMRPYRVGPA
ncbi:MAG TPA: multicopper oxidase [Burkholderiales bacterium]|nr:multicopper oxidase [Burkholderiales bacterium]